MISSQKLLATGLIAASLAAGSSGCAADSPITQEQFIEDANAICADFGAEIEALEWPPSDTDEHNQFLLDEIVPRWRQMVTDIRALGYPAGDEDTLAAIFDDTDAMLDRVEAAPSEDDSEADTYADISERMGAYGLDNCAG